MRIRVLMEGDRVRVLDTTRLDVRTGVVLEDCFLDVSSLDKEGVLLERNVFTTTNDEMQSLKVPLRIVEPDELGQVVALEADGKPILSRAEGTGRLVPSVYDVLYDEDGNFVGDAGEGLCLYYASGSYETVVPTVLSYGDGMLVSDDLIDWSDPATGITWQRGAWTKSDKGLMELRPEATVVVVPEQFENMELATFQGELCLRRGPDGMAAPSSADKDDQGDERDGTGFEGDVEGAPNEGDETEGEEVVRTEDMEG